MKAARGGYQPINDPYKQTVDWPKVPTTGSNAVKLPRMSSAEAYIQYIENELLKEIALRQNAESHASTMEAIANKYYEFYLKEVRRNAKATYRKKAICKHSGVNSKRTRKTRQIQRRYGRDF